MENQNPFASPKSDSRNLTPNPSRIGWKTRALLVSTYSLTGCIAFAFLGSAGFLLLTILLDSFFTPPLNPQENYGQFGMWFIIVTPLMAGLGFTLGIVPIIKWKLYVLVYIVILVLFTIFGVNEFIIHWTDPPIVAINILTLMPMFCAVVLDCGLEKLNAYYQTRNAG